MIGSRPAVAGVDRVAQPTYGMTAGKAHAGGRRHQFVGLRSEGVRVIVLFRTLCVSLDEVGRASSRRTRIGHLVLGSGFDRRDLLAYAAGVLATVLLERAWRRSRPTQAR